MNLYKIETEYSNGIKKLAMSVFVLAEDIEEASDKLSKMISDSPDAFQDWYIATDPELIATNDCGEEGDLLIQ